MPAVARINDIVATGHLGDATTTIQTGSTDVFAEGVGVARQGDTLTTHNILVGSVLSPHPGQTITSGSSTVFVNGKAVARIGDNADAGTITSGAGTVFAN